MYWRKESMSQVVIQPNRANIKSIHARTEKMADGNSFLKKMPEDRILLSRNWLGNFGKENSSEHWIHVIVDLRLKWIDNKGGRIVWKCYVLWSVEKTQF